MIAGVYPHFPSQAFLRDALNGYEDQELMPRGRHIAGVLRRHLPADYATAIAILLASCAQPNPRQASFLFMPHCFFVVEFGLDDFEPSM